MMGLVILTVIFIGAAMAIMAVGVILSGRCLRGSCGTIRSRTASPMSCLGVTTLTRATC